MKKKLVCLPVEVFKREFDAKVFLGVKAVERGYQVVIGHHKDPVLLKTPVGFYLYKDHGRGSVRLVNKWYQDDCVVAALDEEGLIRKSDNLYKQSRVNDQAISKLEVVFAWGDDQKALLQRCGVEKKIVVSGNPRFDLLYLQNNARGFRDGKVASKRKVLVNTRFGSINSAIGEQYVENMRNCGELDTEDDVREWENFKKNERIIFDEFINLIDMLGGEEELDVIVRPHPEELKDTYEKVAEKHPNIVVDFESSLVDHLAWCDVLIHDGCTTAIEGKAMGKEVLGLRPPWVDYDYGTLANQFSINFETPRALVAYLKKPWKREERGEGLDLAASKIANFSSGDSFKKILDTIDGYEIPEVKLVDSSSCRSKKEFSHKAALALYKWFPVKSVFKSEFLGLDKFLDLRKTYDKYDRAYPRITLNEINASIEKACRLSGDTHLLSKIEVEVLSHKSFRLSIN
ncbi:surface carbohydrate biosynthesis protein [uncultured Halomonas sp.]|uniref:surface carbohydrate biosynthesis protein n=1 Tax=uncultured Halomonas sp. TaxID=173971 RepID=UPI00262A2EA5|nr:surface carbohydrate biosynthesis protein [uncultured Halomonas sp.]